MKNIFILFLFLFVNISIQAQITRAFENVFTGQCGFKDSIGNWVGQPTYESAYWYKEAKVGTFRYPKDDSFGLIDEWGKVIFPTGTFQDINVFEKDNSWYVLLTDMNGYKGVSTVNGNIIIPCIYQDIIARSYDYDRHVFEGRYDKGFISQGANGLWGILDFSGNKVIPTRYLGFNFFSLTKGVILVKNENEKWGLISDQGKEIIACKYVKLDMSHYPTYIGLQNEQGITSIIKQNDNTYEDFISFELSDFSDYAIYQDVIKTSNGKKEGLFSHDGELIAPCEYAEARLAGEKIAIVNRGGQKDRYKVVGGKWGYCANGKEIIPCIYDEATVFTNDVATVKKNGEVKLIKNPLKDASQIQIAENVAPSKKKKAGPAMSRYPAPDSDVDKDIPSAKRQAETTFAFIIANENYPDAPVPYSLNDGRMFKEYCQKALGLPEKNINLYEDATFGNIITAVEKMKSIADAYEGDARVIFYYAGHGFPDDKQQTAYLLPIDGDASSITMTGYPLAKLYKEISVLKLKSSIVFLDACFSGAKREDQMLAQSRGVAIKVREEAPQGNMVVFSAAQGDETAHQMEEKHHGLFTYFLLKELQATGGDVDMGTLTEYVTKQVKRQSVVINNKKQTPTVIPSQTLVNSWETMKLK